MDCFAINIKKSVGDFSFPQSGLYCKRSVKHDSEKELSWGFNMCEAPRLVCENVELVWVFLERAFPALDSQRVSDLQKVTRRAFKFQRNRLAGIRLRSCCVDTSEPRPLPGPG